MVSLPAMTNGYLHLFAAVHFACLSLLCLYGMHRIWLLLGWWQMAGTGSVDVPAPFDAGRAPLVTIQLPLFNERFVAERVIDAAAAIDWPDHALEIQVLDDSTDDTREIVSRRVAYWSARGRLIRVIRRPERTGFKAGALANGLRLARGELLAVFDADFIVPPDFLKRTVGCFRQPDVGMVQTRWSFINADDSWLTRLQAMLLAPHFEIEHRVRCRRGLFFNFNGTAGIWRRETIVSAGGWQAGTVTEDLDLSYRAQLRGWRFVYINDVTVPSELPVTLAAFRSQQQRWAKGSIQTARKILPRLLASRLPAAVKIEGFFHLLANCGWLFGALVTVTLYPTLLARIEIGPYQILWIDVPLFAMSGGVVLFYYLAFALARNPAGYTRLLPILPALSIGLAPALAMAVVSGFIRKGGVFLRTPKFGPALREETGGADGYRQPVLYDLFLNTALFCYCQLPLLFAWQRGTWPAIPFLSLFPIGFVLVLATDVVNLFQSAADGRRKRKSA